jgi:hypothetical protein
MFLSNENKGFVWQLLSENKAFDNISNTSFEKIKMLYENTFNQVSTMNNINLTDKNKVVISEMMNHLSEYKNMQIPNKKSVNVTRPLQEVKIQLDKDFESKQEEFIQLVKRPSQAEIKFNEKNDTPFDSNDMESKLNNMMKMRQEELNQILPIDSEKTDLEKIDDAKSGTKKINNTDFINSDNSMDCLDYMWSQWAGPNNNSSVNKDSKERNVDDEKNEKNEKNEKRVTFEMDNTKIIIEKLNQILLNQETILNKLSLSS